MTEQLTRRMVSWNWRGKCLDFIPYQRGSEKKDSCQHDLQLASVDIGQGIGSQDFHLREGTIGIVNDTDGVPWVGS